MRSFDEYKGIEASGKVVFGLVQAFGQFKALPSQLLLAEGIGQKGPDGLVVVDPEGWYPFDAFMRAFERTSQQMSDSVLHQIGVAVGKIAQEPEPMTDMKSFAKIVDQSYHLHHRKNGRVMWDPATRQSLEGIGHYKYRERPDGALEIEADNPYPCAFDRGLMLSAMRKVHAVGAILHDESHPCRKRGQKACLYVVKA
jgi:hypothetical protein